MIELEPKNERAQIKFKNKRKEKKRCDRQILYFAIDTHVMRAQLEFNELGRRVCE